MSRDVMSRVRPQDKYGVRFVNFIRLVEKKSREVPRGRCDSCRGGSVFQAGWQAGKLARTTFIQFRHVSQPTHRTFFRQHQASLGADESAEPRQLAQVIFFANTHGPLLQCAGEKGEKVAANYLQARVVSRLLSWPREALLHETKISQSLMSKHWYINIPCAQEVLAVASLAFDQPLASPKTVH